MGLYKRGNTYWFAVMFERRRIRESLNTDNRKMAEKLYAKVLTDLVEGRYFEGTKSKNVTFDDMSKKYLERHAHSRDEHTIKKLKAFFSGYTLAEIATPLVAEYQDVRSKKVKPATVYQELSLLRRMFNVAKKRWKWVRENPVSDGDLSFSVGNKNARGRWLTPEEQANLITAATNPHWLRSLLVSALHTGMRRGELLALEWRDIDFGRMFIRIEKSKNGEKRSIPMSKTLQATLRAIRVRDISGRVFPISVRSLREAFKAALTKAEIENFKFHDLRHTFATRLVQNGVDLYKVKELLGHKSIAMTMRYAHHYPESLRSSVEVLDVCHNFATIDAMQELTHPVEPHKIR